MGLPENGFAGPDLGEGWEGAAKLRVENIGFITNFFSSHVSFVQSFLQHSQTLYRNKHYLFRAGLITKIMSIL